MWRTPEHLHPADDAHYRRLNAVCDSRLGEMASAYNEATVEVAALDWLQPQGFETVLEQPELFARAHSA